MALKTENGIEVPIPPDDFRPTAQLKKMADTTTVIVEVANLLTANALTKRSGLAVRRLDLPGTPVHVWDTTQSRWTGPSLLDVKPLTPLTGYKPDPAFGVPGVYADGGRVYLEGSFTNTTTNTIPSSSTVNIGQITDLALYPAIAVKFPLIMHGYSDLAQNDPGYLQVAADGKVGIMLVSGRANPPIDSRHIFIENASWRKR